MTDEPTDGLEQRLRRDLGEIADVVPVDESPAPARNVIPLTAATDRRRRPVLAAAGVLGAAAALLIGGLIWQNDDDGPAENVATQDPTTVPLTAAPSPETTAPESVVPPVSTVPPAVASCASLPDLAGMTVQGQSLEGVSSVGSQPDPDSFGAAEGGAESFAVSETFQVEAALPVRPVIDFVGERTAVDGPVRLSWASEGRVEAWVSAEGCDIVGLSVTGGSRDQNALAASELAFIVASEAGLDTTDEPASDCPEPGSGSGDRPVLFFYCPLDDVDQIPRPVEPRDPFLFLSTPTQALQTLFATDPPEGWGSGIPLVMRGADVDVTVDDGVAQLTIDYDFDAAPINGFSTSSMAIAYGNQLGATLFQYPEIQAMDLDTLCCGEWGGQATRVEWEAFLDRAIGP